MNFLSPLLLSISSNLDTLTVGACYKLKKIRITKFNVILISIITSLATFISMYLIKSIESLFDLNLSNTFGSVLLSLIGISFIVDYIRMKKKQSGEDTSYYVESNSKYKEVLESPNIADYDKSGDIDIKETLILSFVLARNNIEIGLAASIAGINIPLSVFFNFIITIISICIGYLIGNKYFSKSFNRYCILTSGILLIILGICETFIYNY